MEGEDAGVRNQEPGRLSSILAARAHLDTADQHNVEGRAELASASSLISLATKASGVQWVHNGKLARDYGQSSLLDWIGNGLNIWFSLGTSK